MRRQVACPIVYGSISSTLAASSAVAGGGRRAGASGGASSSADQATHRWTLYLRGPVGDEDLSCFVSKVAFLLHPSFPEPVREVHSPPFELTETGWGEFEAGIRVFFRDADEQPLDLTHTILLYHPEAAPAQTKTLPVVSEVYDEIVFTDPTPEFKRQLVMYASPAASASVAGGAVRGITEKTEHFNIFSDEEDVRLLTLAHDFVQSEIEAAKAQLLRLEVIANSAAALQQQQIAVGAAQQNPPPAPPPPPPLSQTAAPMVQTGTGAAFLPPPSQAAHQPSMSGAMTSRKGRSTPTSAVDLSAGAGGSVGAPGQVPAAAAVSRGSFHGVPPPSSLPATPGPASMQKMAASASSASAPGLPSTAHLGYQAQPLPSLAVSSHPTFPPTLQPQLQQQQQQQQQFQQVYLTQQQQAQPVLQRGPSAHLLSGAASAPGASSTTTTAATSGGIEGGLSYHSAQPPGPP